MDIRLAPWFNDLWSKKGAGDGDAEERILTLAGEEFAASGLTNSSADSILGAAALKRAASVKDSKLSMSLYLASLKRLLISAAFCNSFGPGGSRAVAAYNQILLTNAARNNCGLAQDYDRALRLRLSSHNLEAEAVVTALCRIGRDLLHDVRLSDSTGSGTASDSKQIAELEKKLKAQSVQLQELSKKLGRGRSPHHRPRDRSRDNKRRSERRSRGRIPGRILYRASWRSGVPLQLGGPGLLVRASD